MCPFQHPEPNPTNYQWTNKLISQIYTDKKYGGRSSHLFVGEWVKIEDDTDPIWAKVSFRGGEGYIPKNDYSNKKFLEIYLLDVGQGDAILIQTPENRRILIDGGAGKHAHSYLQLKYDLFTYPKVFDLIILTHADIDHMVGLTRILKDKNVIPLKIIHNGISKRPNSKVGKPEEVDGTKYLFDIHDDIEELTPIYNQLSSKYQDWYDTILKAKKRTEEKGFNFEYSRVDNKSGIIEIDGLTKLKIKILNPILFSANLNDTDLPCLRWFGDDGKTVNGNSVGAMIEYGKTRFLMCGDMNQESEDLLLQNCDHNDLNAHVFKAQHHGSQFFTTKFLSKVKKWLSVISSGDGNKWGHPKANLLGSLGRYSDQKIEKPLVFSTELAATYKKIPESKLKEKSIQGYEKNIHGIIYFKTNGNWIAGGRVYKRTDKEGTILKTSWKWEAYALDILSGDPLQNSFLKFP